MIDFIFSAVFTTLFSVTLLFSNISFLFIFFFRFWRSLGFSKHTLLHGKTRYALLLLLFLHSSLAEFDKTDCVSKNNPREITRNCAFYVQLIHFSTYVKRSTPQEKLKLEGRIINTTLSSISMITSLIFWCFQGT